MAERGREREILSWFEADWKLKSFSSYFPLTTVATEAAKTKGVEESGVIP